MNIFLRNITEDDKQLLFDWANDVETRKNSFNSSPIPWSVHEQWFEDHLHNEVARIYVAYDEDGNDLGQIRFEKNQDHAVAGMSIDKAFRGKGISTELLNKGCEAIFAEWQDITFVRGKVKRGNIRSWRSLIKAKFEEEERDGDTIVYRRFRG